MYSEQNKHEVERNLNFNYRIVHAYWESRYDYIQLNSAEHITKSVTYNKHLFIVNKHFDSMHAFYTSKQNTKINK